MEHSPTACWACGRSLVGELDPEGTDAFPLVTARPGSDGGPKAFGPLLCRRCCTRPQLLTSFLETFSDEHAFCHHCRCEVPVREVQSRLTARGAVVAVHHPLPTPNAQRVLFLCPDCVGELDGRARHFHRSLLFFVAVLFLGLSALYWLRNW